MENFENIMKEIHKERMQQEQQEQHNPMRKQEIEYALYCVWCRANGYDYNQLNHFQEYCKNENPNINFFIKKHIIEKISGKKYKFDYNSMQWIAEKNIN